MSAKRPILLFGAGRMGGAMLERWLQSGFDPASIIVCDPDPPPASAEIIRRAGLRLNAPIADLADLPPEMIVFAVKPPLVTEAANAAASIIAPDSVLLSVAAGVSITTLLGSRPLSHPAVRAMPNSPARIGKGAIAACASAGLEPRQKDHCTRLLAVLGAVHWIADEADMDAITALSGSGPAYVFALVEAMTAAGCEIGLNAELAARLARETLIGAAGLLEQECDHAPADLRAQVTSPGGTTEAALNVLLSGGAHDLTALLRQAMAAAARRSRQLGA